MKYINNYIIFLSIYFFALSKLYAVTDREFIDAICENNSELVQDLIAQNANTNCQDDLKLTALMHAVSVNNIAIVRLLLDHNAHITINSRDISGMTALMIAADLSRLVDNYEIIELLINAGANILEKDFTGKLAQDYAVNPAIREILSPKP